MRIAVFTYLIVVSFFSAIAQNASGTYTAIRLTGSSTSFLCDLGGKNGNGSNDISDLNLEQTRFALGAGYQVYISQFSFGLNAFYGRLSADDRLTSAPRRAARKLHVVTDVIETSFNIEYEIPPNIPLLKNIYFNAGIGLVYFEPRARYGDELVKLRPLGTEGQNYLPDRSQYSYVALMIPYGFGYRFNLKDNYALSLDFNLRKSFSDYLDDVSTNYADPEQVTYKAGWLAGYFSDPSQNDKNIGAQRGDPKDNDQYFLIGFRLEIPIRVAYKNVKFCPYSVENRHWPLRPVYRSSYRK